MSGTMNKIKAKVDNVLHKDSSSTSDPTGPHNSRIGNKADPRVDSDQMGGAGNTASAGGYNTTGRMTGTTGAYGSNTSDPTGPHDSRMANKMDPRVDSDQYGAAGNTGSATNTGTTGMTGAMGTTGSTGGFGSNVSDPTGPHDSRLANKADPRVDSDRMGGAGNTASAGGYNTTGGMTGSGGMTGTTGNYGSDPTGPHDSRMANKMDPRVDSDKYGAAGNTQSAGGVGGVGGAHTGQHHHHHQHHPGTVGSGNASNTAGPHNSDLLNKADPRVDSDLDGSKTVGGNHTYQ